MVTVVGYNHSEHEHRFMTTCSTGPTPFPVPQMDQIIAANRLFLALLLLQLSGVELEFLALQYVTIATADLSWPRRNASQQTTSIELVSKTGLQDAINVSASDFLLHFLALSRQISRLNGVGLLGLVHDDTVVLLIPLTESSGINLDNAVLDEGLGTHQLVVGGVVNDIQNTGLAGCV